MLYWMDGQLKTDAEVRVPLLSHSLHYGSAVFDGLRFYETDQGPAVFRLTEHMERFLFSAKKIGFTIPYSLKELCQVVVDTIKANKLSAGYIRPLAFWGEGDMELHPTIAQQHVAVAVWPWKPRLGEKAIRVKISSFLRTPPQSTIISAKFTGHYANSILARQEARKEGYHEALFLDYKGNISEGPGANFFAIQKGVLLTPPEDTVFAGITRHSILELAKHIGIPTKIQTIHPDSIPLFDEAFFVGTAVEVVSIKEIDEKVIKNAPGEITSLLHKLYKNVVSGKEDDNRNWLTRITL